MSHKLHYSEHTRCNQKHCLGEAERLRLQAGLSYRPKGAAAARAPGSGPQTQPGATSWPCPRPQPPPVIAAPGLGSGGPARRTPASTDTLPGDHKFMNPRSFTCSGAELGCASRRHFSLSGNRMQHKDASCEASEPKSLIKTVEN